MASNRQLRAYEVPPYRAEEWHFWSDYQSRTANGGPASRLRIEPNSQPLVPDGYRGVLTVLHVPSIIVYNPPYRFTDLSSGNRYNLRINGVVVPGYQGRPASSRMSYMPLLGTYDGANLSLEAWTTAGVIEPVVVVPPRLQARDLIEIEFVAAQDDIQTAVLAQGYWWPVSAEDNSGRGNLADPI